MHAAFLVSIDSGQRDHDGEEDLSLLYAYPPNPPAGSTGSYAKSFSSLIVTVRGALDSICGEKTKLVHLDQGGGRLLLALAHLESVVLVLALRVAVPPSAATSLVLHLAETLVLLLGPFAAWGLGRGSPGSPQADLGSPHQAEPHQPQSAQQHEAETRAILDRVFEGVLSQIQSARWGARMAPWNSFESGCLHLALPGALHQRLAALVADHSAQRQRAPFSFFRKHSCLMFRGLLLASDLHPLHARQLWQLLWALGVLQNSGGLPCQVLTRIVHLPQPPPAAPPPAAATASAAVLRPGASGNTAAAAAAGGVPTAAPGSGSGGAAAATAAAAAAVALQAEAGVTVSEQPMGRSLLVVVSALRFVLAVVLTAYDEEIEEELAGRLEGHSAAELLQRIHTNLGLDLERLVEASAVYSSAVHSLDPPPPLGHLDPPTAYPRSPVVGPVAGKTGAAGAVPSFSGGSLLFRALTRNKSTGRRRAAQAAAVAGAELAHVTSSSPTSPVTKGPFPRSASAMMPPGHPAYPPIQTHPAALHRSPGAAPPAGQPHDRSFRGGSGAFGSGAAAVLAAPLAPPLQLPPPPAFLPVPAPEGVLFLIAHDVPQGCVRFLGDLPGAGGGSSGGGSGAMMMTAVWRAVAACRARFGLHNVAVAAPPKHARLTMTLDQIQQLSAARSQKSGGQRLGAADSSPWQYHPELASLAAVNTVTLRLPGLRLTAQGTVVMEGEGGGVRDGGGGASGLGLGQSEQHQQATPLGKSWLARISGSRHGSRTASPDGSSGGGGAPAPAEATTPPPAGTSIPLPAAATAASPFTTPIPPTAGSGPTPSCTAASSGAVYLTGVLFPDTREVYMCHGAELDEARLVEAMWEGSGGCGVELWVRESLGVAS